MIKIKNLDDLQQFAVNLTARLKSGDVVLLEGDLGAGKTTLSQMVGRLLGVRRTINSPTFNIIKSYQGSNLAFHHMDCYRLENSDEDLGFEEYFEDDAITFIEWSQFIQDYLPSHFLRITINVMDENTRTIDLDASGVHFEQIKEALEHD
ncbi:tRNA (adenosine(37)-N6)-threonylcarbamoyltransferase complex ATPase subunit type 1 TsaE [Staphylococcus hyicus]|uniref:tRNA (adenosine(37)-N6)-threonylcarbamoyltransferase complex ATPase subunit type 1 TsaE n=1 Tax=Staphylococcus hyicus TaxID=1284 RepID=UPI00057EE48D|nr:tRNA (adenosine(37)-N6)-threonylcarbamoyltransferase complex ATPase subunit type 1 TsaE [Staphylococcus hyicus]AJC95595.1 ATPase [Staphylococcus hyicus]MCE5155054.1 tRNA (adenosine(37)-N6)-threonylcarbamoyltransferase complex ATPase subunit type 1 TsaE [Staphylococcus hyicus]MDP4449378.1 tRNA (adenosine(37)-N6)-threonylcarbamoyltransferase complex ATPase subunit type 1 TsaE [Staphylococcus hyicus]MDP4469559.1 tRNA (adenosine(37)-N6)-threonylcarbamoyltransferase complex ATPase subunit type 1 